MTSDKIMVIQPKDCHNCGNGFYALNHAINHIRSKGWDTIVMSDNNANKQPVFNAIDKHDPCAIYGFGHGLNCNYTGDSEEDIFTCSETGEVKGRVVYLLSCNTANGLGPEMINKGAIAYAGFTISWTWLSTNVSGDAYRDKYAKGFYESANELFIQLANGLSFKEAVQKSIDKYDEWIDYWFYTNPEDEYSQECIKWLAVDRDGLYAINKCEGKVEASCNELDCYWCNNKCNAMPEHEGGGSGGIALVVIPIILVVGIALIVGQTKHPKNKYR